MFYTDDSWKDEIGARVLTAKRMEGRWMSGWDDDKAKPIHSEGEYWTVIDRDSGDLIGSFGLPVQMATCEEALDEAERFGSKWGWPTDREAVVE